MGTRPHGKGWMTQGSSDGFDPTQPAHNRALEGVGGRATGRGGVA